MFKASIISLALASQPAHAAVDTKQKKTIATIKHEEFVAKSKATLAAGVAKLQSGVTTDRELATVASTTSGYAGYYYYSGTTCGGTIRMTEAFQLGLCYHDTDSTGSMMFSCDADSSTVTMYATDDCSGDSSEAIDPQLTTCETGDGESRKFFCSSSSAPWSSMGTSVLMRYYTDPLDCGTSDSIYVNSLLTNTCIDGELFECGGSEFTYKMYDTATCTGTPLEITASTSELACIADDDYYYSYDGDDSPLDTAASTISCANDDDSEDSVCFHGDSLVQTEAGEKVAISALKVGDRVLVANADSQKKFADVVFLPHAVNSQKANFVTLKTSDGHSVRMTLEHLVPAGSCASAADHSLVAAGSVSTGMCLQTSNGLQEVVSASTASDNGVYTIVTSDMSGMVVVDGVAASSFGLNHGVANTYYHVHRAAYAALNAVGMPTATILGHGLVQKANMMVGNVAVFLGKLARFI